MIFLTFENLFDSTSGSPKKFYNTQFQNLSKIKDFANKMVNCIIIFEKSTLPYINLTKRYLIPKFEQNPSKLLNELKVTQMKAGNCII